MEHSVIRDVIGRYGTAIAGLALILFFLVFAPNFASTMNIINVLKDTSFLAILAIGFTLAFTVAELDLSIAEVASLAAVVCGWLVQTQYPPAVAVGSRFRWAWRSARSTASASRCCVSPR